MAAAGGRPVRRRPQRGQASEQLRHLHHRRPGPAGAEYGGQAVRQPRRYAVELRQWPRGRPRDQAAHPRQQLRQQRDDAQGPGPPRGRRRHDAGTLRFCRAASARRRQNGPRRHGAAGGQRLPPHEPPDDAAQPDKLHGPPLPRGNRADAPDVAAAPRAAGGCQRRKDRRGQL